MLLIERHGPLVTPDSCFGYDSARGPNNKTRAQFFRSIGEPAAAGEAGRNNGHVELHQRPSRKSASAEEDIGAGVAAKLDESTRRRCSWWSTAGRRSVDWATAGHVRSSGIIREPHG